MRQDQVGHQEVDRPRELFRQSKRIGTVRSLQHTVAGALQNGTNIASHGIPILHHQYGSRTLHSGDGMLRAGFGRSFGRDARQIDMERRAFVQLTGDLDPPRTLLDNPVNRGQPEPCSFPKLLRREEGFEQAPFDLIAHPRPGIRHAKVHEIPVRLHILRLDDDLASVRHRVARIHQQVHQNLVQLAGIGHHVSQRRAEPGHQLDVFAEQRPEHLLRLSHHLVQIQNLGLRQLLPAEGEEVPRQLGSPFARRANLHQVGVILVIIRPLHQQQVAIAVDHGKQVIEIVRNAAGQPADALHFLRLQVLRLHLFALRDVAQRRLGPGNPSSLYYIRDQRLDPDPRPVRAQALVFVVVGHALAPHAPVAPVAQRGAPFRGYAIFQDDFADVPSFQSEPFQETAVGEYEAPLGVIHDDCVVDVLDQPLIAFLDAFGPSPLQQVVEQRDGREVARQGRGDRQRREQEPRAGQQERTARPRSGPNDEYDQGTPPGTGKRQREGRRKTGQ